MKDNSYLTIQSWMRTELNLSGNELLVYAIIYGFSQDETSRFSGSRQYLADWCGCTVRSIQTILNSLTEKELITKYESTRQGVKFCEYVANFTSSEKISPPSEKISLNNIAYNIEENNIITGSNNNESEFDSHSYSPEDLKQERKSEFLGSGVKKEKPKKKNLYEKCLDEVYLFTKDLSLQALLINYLSVRLSIKGKPLYNVNQWISMLNKLDKMEDKSKVVEQSIEKGWCSFYPLKSFNKDALSEGDGVYSEPAQDTEEERRQMLESEGRRSSF